MNWPIPKNVIAVDFSKNCFSISKARYSFKRLIVIHQDTRFSEDVEEWRKSVKSVKISPEDVVVATIDTGMVLFIDTNIPLKSLKKKELTNIGKAEAARVMGIPINEISVSPVGIGNGRGLFAVAKEANIESSVVQKLKSLGLPEPDVVIPDSMKYLQAVVIPTQGTTVYIVVNFFKNYISTFLTMSGEIVSSRSIYPTLDEIFNILENKFDLSLPEVYMSSDLNEDSELFEFLKDGFANLAMEINREIVQLLRYNENLSMEKVDLISLIVDPLKFSMPFSEALSEVLNENISVEKVRGMTGLLMRGGREFGKVVKSVQQES